MTRFAHIDEAHNYIDQLETRLDHLRWVLTKIEWTLDAGERFYAGHNISHLLPALRVAISLARWR